MEKKEYIERNDAFKAFPEYSSDFARFRIRNIPSADVVPWSWLEKLVQDAYMSDMSAKNFIKYARKEWENGEYDSKLTNSLHLP